MPRVFVRSAVVRSPCCIFSWRDAAHQCGWHDKNDPLFGGFSSLRSLKIGIFPGRKKVSQGKPTEKWVVFIRAGKPCRPSSIQGAPAGKGSPHDSAWIGPSFACGLIDLSRASQFGSTLVGNRRLGGLCLGSGGKDDAGDLTAKSQVRRMRCPALHLLQRRWSSARRLSRAPPPCSSSAAS